VYPKALLVAGAVGSCPLSALLPFLGVAFASSSRGGSRHADCPLCLSFPHAMFLSSSIYTTSPLAKHVYTACTQLLDAMAREPAPLDAINFRDSPFVQGPLAVCLLATPMQGPCLCTSCPPWHCVKMQNLCASFVPLPHVLIVCICAEDDIDLKIDVEEPAEVEDEPSEAAHAPLLRPVAVRPSHPYLAGAMPSAKSEKNASRANDWAKVGMGEHTPRVAAARRDLYEMVDRQSQSIAYASGDLDSILSGQDTGSGSTSAAVSRH
jgi:hypothetical protein